MLIWLTVLVIISLVVFFNYGRIMVLYIYTFGSKNFEAGQKVYLSKDILDAKIDVIAELRLIRPVTEKEVRDSLFFSNETRDETLAIAQKKGLNPVLQYFNYGINISKLKSAGSAAIGTFIDKKIMTFKTPNGELGKTVFYIIKPYPNIIDNNVSNVEVPKGYKLADDLMYVFCSNATDSETLNSTK